MGLVDDLRHQAGCLDYDTERATADLLHRAADEIAAVEARAYHLADERIELQGRIALAVDALDCCSSCVRTWLIGELDDEQRSLVVQEQSRVAARAEGGE